MESKFYAKLNEYRTLLESNRTKKPAPKKGGKMRDLLGIKEGEKIEDKFKTGQELVDTLVAALKGNKKKAHDMIMFLANVQKKVKLYADAAKIVKKFTLMESRMDSLKQVLMRRDNMTSQEAADEIEDIRKRVLDGEDPEEILMDDYGLEPDYIIDIL